MQINNVTFDEIAIGDTATYTRLITNQEVEAFAAISGITTHCTSTPNTPPPPTLANVLHTGCSRGH